ncbi:MAG: GH92 family glycosyl hydrolase [Acidobacteriota bacterium]|nr:GH92 family glycosyl hydrolase [Acidobacteriota bacterium]
MSSESNPTFKGLKPGRRTFLKASSAAALGAAFAPSVTASATASSTQKQKQSDASTVDLVNILQGTDSTYTFSRGNTLPIAATPFGTSHWTLQSEGGTPWFFLASHRRLQGFRCTHQLSSWLSDYGYAVFLPFSGDPNPEPGARSSSWRPEQAELRPYSMRVEFLRYQVQSELVPTERCCVVQSTNGSGNPSGFLIEIPAGGAVVSQDKFRREIQFTSTINEGGVPANFATYYVVRFDQPLEDVEVVQLKKGQAIVCRFGKEQTTLARIATSFISFDQAVLNLDREVGTKSIDDLRTAAKATWTDAFSRLEVEGGSDKQRRTFYSCLYRALLFPRVWHELDTNGKTYHYSAYTGKISPGVMYADHGYWDVYRAWYPFMSVVYPERLGEILQAWVNAYSEGGWLPQFPAPGYRACMTGSLIDSVFGDAAAKGIQGFDLATAYKGLYRHATEPGDPDKGYGRRGIEEYLKLGYVSTDEVEQSVAETTDAAYGDFCIAQVAKALGKHDDAAKFMKRSENWRVLFDPGTGFMRGKKRDGSMIAPFDPFQWGSPYVEGSAWQHRWDAPHDMSTLFEKLGGSSKVVEILEKMCTQDPVFHVGVYGQEIHEMSEMAAVDFGQYAHSNQPVHHVLYIFALAGRPDRTQYWVRRVMDELYSPETFAGDEDTGSMAAWYVMSAMGFFPVCPGKAEYVVGKSLFPAMTVRLPGSKTLRIVNHSPDSTSQHAELNGRRLDQPILSHADVMAGGNLRFI